MAKKKNGTKKKTAPDTPAKHHIPLGLLLILFGLLAGAGMLGKAGVGGELFATFASWFLGNWSINQIILEGSAKAGVAANAENIGYFPLPYDDSGKYNVNSGPDYGLSVAANTKNPVTAKAWLDFLLTKSNISQMAGFIPGYKKLEPTLPQLAEIQSYGPTIIEQIPPGPAYTNAANLINYSGGHGLQSLILADDYNAAIDKLNTDWADAASRQ